MLRGGLIGVTVLGILGTAFELATEQHWKNWEQLVAWGALVLLAVAVALVAFRDSPRGVAVARALSLAVLLAAVFGVYAHVAANYGAGPLDQRYAATWESLPVTLRWWYAFTKSVGPAPSLAPGALAQTALVLLLASLIRRPGTRGPTAGPGRKG
ncbi:hypothetical protein GCM10017600_48820 [Streptosporangium carneum]|uniref:Uncharacterized protein n=1 Tax=Streptosporangium carneum TaxID=47481 RepID=A0A9W6I3N6_9ACTN|nr:hypothetical protein GCM10017600_48820 [Streptosporangium carneum]